jgi:hypothetical protein
MHSRQLTHTATQPCSQAIAIARELGLDQVVLNESASAEDKVWMRIKQRVWLSLFVANTM